MIDLDKNKGKNSNITDNSQTQDTFFGIDGYSKEATTAKVLSKEGLFSFAGRRGRAKYFWINVALAILGNILTAIFKENGFLLFVFGMLILYVQCTNIAKRMHDVEMPGKYALIPLVALFFAGIIGSSTFAGICILAEVVFSLYLLFKKGTEGNNKYGPDPLK